MFFLEEVKVSEPMLANIGQSGFVFFLFLLETLYSLRCRGHNASARLEQHLAQITRLVVIQVALQLCWNNFAHTKQEKPTNPNAKHMKDKNAESHRV